MKIFFVIYFAFCTAVALAAGPAGDTTTSHSGSTMSSPTMMDIGSATTPNTGGSTISNSGFSDTHPESRVDTIVPRARQSPSSTREQAQRRRTLMPSPLPLLSPNSDMGVRY